MQNDKDRYDIVLFRIRMRKEKCCSIKLFVIVDGVNKFVTSAFAEFTTKRSGRIFG